MDRVRLLLTLVVSNVSPLLWCSFLSGISETTGWWRAGNRHRLQESQVMGAHRIPSFKKDRALALINSFRRKYNGIFFISRTYWLPMRLITIKKKQVYLQWTGKWSFSDEVADDVKGIEFQIRLVPRRKVQCQKKRGEIVSPDHQLVGLIHVNGSVSCTK